MAKRIMIQGTMSNVGKSLLVAGLCRVFQQDGFCVAPFKSQNMALNSYITKEGLEMSRAQVMQCEAAKIEPSVLMNPILLKPTGDMGSQVIVNGEVMGNMRGIDYFQYKRNLIPTIMDSFEKLSHQVDIIVIEGAGSPAEINLKENDIVNMGLAQLVDAPVLLAGDIDRGGVFAQLLGTLMLLEEREKERVKGLIINKFRGDIDILRPGITMLEKRCHKEVFGIIPFLPIHLEEEDSQGESLFQKEKRPSDLDIAVLHFPRISNFTDFHRWETINGVSLRYVTHLEELGHPDMICLPGSKNTMEDLLWMRQQGMEKQICHLAKEGTVVFGICGGYQMMGKLLKDPDHVEMGGELNGMGLLPVETIFQRQKKRTRVKGCFLQVEGQLQHLSHAAVEGYEIHMGHSIVDGKPLLEIQQENMEPYTDGAYCGNCYGTYVHGVFDHKETTRAILDALLERKGRPKESIVLSDYKEYKEEQYDILADSIRKNLDMDKIYHILDKGI